MNKNKKAFTLVELIVVIIIIAILGTIAFISLQGYSLSARDSTRITDLSSMKTSLELFHLDAGKYPETTAGFVVTYSGTEVWTQGTFGETTTSNVEKLDKTPKDPLTDKEYTYSITKTKQEYQLAGLIEGEEIVLNNNKLLNKTNAAEIVATAIVTGNYNGVLFKAETGTKCEVLSVPSIISTQGDTQTNLIEILEDKNLVYNGYNNLPSNYKGSKYKTNEGFEFETKKLVVYSDDQECKPLYDAENATARIELMKNLKTAYSGTIIENSENITGLVKLDTSDTDAVNILSATLVNNNLGGNIIANNVIYNTCSFNGNILEHNENVTAYNEETILWNASYDCVDRKLTKTCNNGILSGDSAYQYTNCVKGTPTNCTSSPSYTYNTHTYNIPAINHGAITTNIISTNVSQNNGIFNYTLTSIGCNDGTLINQNESSTPTVVSCNSGFVISGNSCVPSFPSSCNGSQSITYSDAVTNRDYIYSNITNYIGCQISDYPGGIALIAGKTVSSKILVSSLSDDGIVKYGYYGITTNATSLTNGWYNTQYINTSGTAGNLCWYKGGLTGVWFLPATDELNEFFTRLKSNGIGGFSLVYYRASSQYNGADSRYQDLDSGFQNAYHKNGNLTVRCASSF